MAEVQQVPSQEAFSRLSELLGDYDDATTWSTASRTTEELNERKTSVTADMDTFVHYSALENTYLASFELAVSRFEPDDPRRELLTEEPRQDQSDPATATQDALLAHSAEEMTQDAQVAPQACTDDCPNDTTTDPEDPGACVAHPISVPEEQWVQSVHDPEDSGACGTHPISGSEEKPDQSFQDPEDSGVCVAHGTTPASEEQCVHPSTEDSQAADELAQCQDEPAIHGPEPTDEPDCKRVRINDNFEIRNTSLGGSGSFAVRELRFGDAVLYERLLIRTNGYTLEQQFADLDPLGKRVYLCLHPHRRRNEEGQDVLSAICQTNNFHIPGNGGAVFPIASRFNHKCAGRSNVDFDYDAAAGLMVFTVKAERVATGEELTISYGGQAHSLYERYGFFCNCGGCDGFNEEEAAARAALEWV